MQGVLATAVRYNLESWAVTKRGPVYPPMFIPLITVFTTVLGSIFLGDAITIGRFAASTSCRCVLDYRYIQFLMTISNY